MQDGLEERETYQTYQFWGYHNHAAMKRWGPRLARGMRTGGSRKSERYVRREMTGTEEVKESQGDVKNF